MHTLLAHCPGQPSLGTSCLDLCSPHPSPQPRGVARVRGVPETGPGLGDVVRGRGQGSGWNETGPGTKWPVGLWPGVGRELEFQEGHFAPSYRNHTGWHVGRGWSWTQAGSQGLGDKGKNRQNGTVEKNNSGSVWKIAQNSVPLRRPTQELCLPGRGSVPRSVCCPFLHIAPQPEGPGLPMYLPPGRRPRSQSGGCPSGQRASGTARCPRLPVLFHPLPWSCQFPRSLSWPHS